MLLFQGAFFGPLLVTVTEVASDSEYRIRCAKKTHRHAHLLTASGCCINIKVGGRNRGNMYTSECLQTIIELESLL